MLGIDPTVLMIVLLLIGLGAAMVFIGQMKSRVDKLEAGLVRQGQLFSKFVADTAVMFSSGNPAQIGVATDGQENAVVASGGAAPEALATAREVASPGSRASAGDQFTVENPRSRIPIPDQEQSSEEYESSDSDDDVSEGDDDLSSEASEALEDAEDLDSVETVDLSGPYGNSTDTGVKVVSLEPNEPSQAALSISQMYNITMMGGPVPTEDDGEPRVEELDASSLGDEEESLGSVDGKEDDEAAEEEAGEKEGDEDTAVMKKMKVAELRSLVVTMNLSSVAEVAKLKKPELLKLIEDSK
jgi:hypothetical protein